MVTKDELVARHNKNGAAEEKAEDAAVQRGSSRLLQHAENTLRHQWVPGKEVEIVFGPWDGIEGQPSVMKEIMAVTRKGLEERGFSVRGTVALPRRGHPLEGNILLHIS